MENEKYREFTIRTAKPSDHHRVIRVMPDWWKGRDLTAMLPKLFLIHFADTSFVIEKDGELAGFLVGFLSPTCPDEGYVHFMGVHPDHQKKGLGTFLYNRFFEICRRNGRRVVRACTSPVNRDSIAFHQRIGFSLEPGDGEVDGIPYTSNYNRPADEKVLFKKELQ